MRKLLFLLPLFLFCACTSEQASDRQISQMPVPEGYELAWHDEFDGQGPPDSVYWSFEEGFVRNHELQWYQAANAFRQDGKLVIEARRERLANPDHDPESESWKRSRPFAEYTSACVKTKGKFTFQYGILEVRARLDTALGLWPAIWTLGERNRWPANGEIDVMEYYRSKEDKITPIILANGAWQSDTVRGAVWDAVKVPLDSLTGGRPGWHERFHVWRMEWDSARVALSLDGRLLNEIDVSEARNSDGFLPFRQPHYVLLNLAIGSNGGDPSATPFPKRYEVDYVRVFRRFD